jgi:hypothetical protein
MEVGPLHCYTVCTCYNEFSIADNILRTNNAHRIELYMSNTSQSVDCYL